MNRLTAGVILVPALCIGTACDGTAPGHGDLEEAVVRIADEPTSGMVEEDGTFRPEPDADSPVLGVQRLEAALAEGDVTVSTGSGPAEHGQIIVADDLTWENETALVLRAGQDVRLLEDVTITHTGAASLTLRADKSATGNGTVQLHEAAQLDFTEGDTVEILYNPPEGYDSPVGFADRVIVAADENLRAMMLVNDVDDLQAMQDNLSGNYALGGDIDATETAEWNDGAGFEPIGDEDDPFTGTLDGRGHTIEGLTINRPGERFVGLFARVAGEAAIQSVEVAEANVHGGGFQFDRQLEEWIDGGVGALAGWIGDEASVTDAEASGDVSGEGGVGGMVGVMRDDASMTASQASGDVSGEGPGVGGLVGVMGDGASVTASQARGDVSGRGGGGGLVGDMSHDASATASQASGDVSGEFWYVGGLIGSMGDDSSVTASQASGDVSGIGPVGGLVGWMLHSASMTASQASGDVTGEDWYVGGLVGQMGGPFGPNSPTIEQTYATGHVEGDDAEAGGLIGLIEDVDEDGNVSASFFDTDATGTEEAVGKVTDSDDLDIDITGLPTARMQTAEPYIEAGWDFEERWTIEEGETYPRLRVLEEVD